MQKAASMASALVLFLASQGALEVMYVSEWVSESADRDFTDVTLVSEDTYQRLPWYDHDDHDDPDYLNDHDDWKCIFPKCILQKCIFWRSTFRNCIFQRFFFLKCYFFLKVYFPKGYFLNVYFLKVYFMKVFHKKTVFFEGWLPLVSDSHHF